MWTRRDVVHDVARRQSALRFAASTALGLGGKARDLFVGWTRDGVVGALELARFRRKALRTAAEEQALEFSVFGAKLPKRCG